MSTSPSCLSTATKDSLLHSHIHARFPCPFPLPFPSSTHLSSPLPSIHPLTHSPLAWAEPGSPQGKEQEHVISERGVIFRTGDQDPRWGHFQFPVLEDTSASKASGGSQASLFFPLAAPSYVPLLSNNSTLGLPIPTSQMGKLRHREGMGVAIPSSQGIVCFSEDCFFGLMGEGVGGTHEGLAKPEGRA